MLLQISEIDLQLLKRSQDRDRLAKVELFGLVIAVVSHQVYLC